MTKKILILTQPNDLHAETVAAALARRGASAVLWHTSNFPTRARESVRFEAGRRSIQIVGPETLLEDDDFDVVWHRRPALHVVDPTAIDPADLEFVEMGCTTFRRGLLDTLARDAFWVNDYVSALRAESKIRQLTAAIEVGLDTPATLCSNDPEQIRDFLHRHGGEVVFKPLHPGTWKNGDAVYGNYASVVRAEDLVADELLQAVPGIFQERIAKAFELRLTMIGEHAVTARLNSQRTAHGKLDWRKSYDELVMEPFAAPPALVGLCRELLRRLGLVFGCFDFVVTPDGRFVFLEVNQMGQFLFVERYAGVPILDAFASMLIAGRADFGWHPDGATLRYAELEDDAYRAVERGRATHVARIHRDVEERAPA